MSLSYGFITSTNNDYYKHKSSNPILKLLEDAPPSYSFVLAEKYQQERLGEKLDDEISTLLKSMKRSMQETEILLISYQHYCQRLEIKNQNMIKILQLVIASENDTNTINNKSEQDTNDSLSRMNNSLEKLIQEAESSLKTRPSLHQESKSRFIKSSTSTNKLKLQQQKNRYLYSQWKLAIAMKQLLSTVQKQESTTNDQQVHHYHHIHHHHYHHIYVDNTIAQEVIHKEPTNISTSSISSFFKYALDIVGGFIPSLSSNSSKLPKSVKYRTIFLSSLLILQRYNKRNLWSRRGQYLMHAWKSRRFYLYTHWVQKAHLLHFMLQIFASSSSSSASSKRHLF